MLKIKAHARHLLDLVNFILLTLPLRRFSTRSDIHIVTGADSSHCRSLLNLLKTVQQYEPTATVSIWNLGLSASELTEIKSKFPQYELKFFDFDAHESHMNISINAGEYAWKPTIISYEAENSERLTLWLDAGNILTKRLNWIRRFTSRNGFFSPFSSGSLDDWTHPIMLEHYNVSADIRKKSNLNGAIVAFACSYPEANYLLHAWVECAQNKDCIAPPGSNRKNHRQDQAALSVLAHLQGMAPTGFHLRNTALIGIRIHQDVEQISEPRNIT